MNEEIKEKTETLQPFTKLCMTIGQLPSSYVESMSYYEQLIWFTKYLQDQVIPAVNQNAAATEELQRYFIELQDYVNHYFDNLDVQEEINNKLDKMAEDGSLTGLITSYIDPFIEEQNNEINNFKNAVNSQLNLQNNLINSISITPLVASSTSGMTDTNRIYVNTTDGYWYYYNGSAWTQGSLYQSEAIDNISYSQLDSNLKTLVDSNIDFSKIIDSTITGTVIKTTKENELFTTKITGRNYGNGFTKLNSDYYTYNGFTLKNIASSPTQGFVIGYVDDDEDDFLMMMVSQAQTGSIYRISHGENLGKIGNFNNVSNTKDVIIVSLTSNVLTFKTISTSNYESTFTYDLTSITDTINPIIGFAPFTANETTYNYNLVLYPYANFDNLVDDIHILDEQINKKNALYDIANKGIKNGDSFTIKLLGDSITAGYGGTGYDVSATGGGDKLFWDVYQNITGYCWANLLKEYVETKYNNITIKNYGVSGANIYNLNQYYNSVPLVDNNDDIVVVMIGTNDRDNTKNNFFLNLQNLYTKILNSGKKLILMTSIPASISNEETHTLHMEDIAMFNQSFATINNIPFINVYEEFIKYCINTNTSIDSLLSDGLHPNDNGYKVMFEIISNKLGFDTKRPN